MLEYGMNIPLDRPRISYSMFLVNIYFMRLEYFPAWDVCGYELFFSKILCTGSSVSDFSFFFWLFRSHSRYVLVVYIEVTRCLYSVFFGILSILVNKCISFNLLLCWILFVCSLPHLTTVIVKLILPFLLLSRSRNRILNLH